MESILQFAQHPILVGPGGHCGNSLQVREHENRHCSEPGGQDSGLYNHVVHWQSDQGVSGSIWFAP